MTWTTEEIEFLKQNYQLKGKLWCMTELNKSEGQVRSKAARLNLSARGISEACINRNKQHALILKGRKRPEQSELIKKMHAEGAFKRTEEQNLNVGKRVKKWISENGHPRGALGMKHTEATKLIISEKSKSAAKSMTDDQILSKTKKAANTRMKNGTIFPMARLNASWKSGWRNIGDNKKYYRSRWEANYARYLEWLRQKGHILKWEHEPETFWFDGIKRGCVSYLPDFRVTELCGTIVYHEVKGWMDDRSKTKIKRMGIYFPKVKLIVVESKQYKDVEKKVSAMIEGWE